MTQRRITSGDLAPLYTTSIGVDQLFENLISNFNGFQQNYPPYNIIKHDDDHYVLELAIAGFGEDDINLIIKNNVLIIEADKKNNDEELTYLHKGIGVRKFNKTFPLAEHVEVKAALVKNGILSIDLYRNIPEQLLPKRIAIDFK